MTTNPTGTKQHDSSDTSPLSVCCHPVRPMEVEQPPGELEWSDFVDSLRSGFLPGDGEQRSPFDQTLRFEISDPHATDGGVPRVYAASTETGGPNWHLLFEYLLQNCQHVQHYDTVYLLVDTRDLTKVEEVEPTLAHWPAVAAWWSSRLRHLGPGDEQVDLVFVRAAKGTGLHLVHPTWAGTFVLAAMVFLFPNTHFVLCVPVTLFEIEELWALTTQALTFNRVSEQQGEADGPAHKARKTRQDDEDNPGQRVILVTEPHTDINAGLVIILGSDHDSPLDLADAAEEAGQLPLTGQDDFFFSNAFVTCFWYHGNRNGHSTSLGEKAKGDDAVIKKTLCFTMVKI